MNQIKTSLIPFLLVIVIAFFLLDFGEGKIEFEQLAYDELPDEMKDGVLLEFGPGFTGVYELNQYTYAYIGTEPNEKAVIEFVGDAHDGIGKEVRYSVSKLEPGEEPTIIDGRFGEYTPNVIRIKNRITTPFGFFKVDE